MTGQCSVCESAVPDTAVHCTTCGFPLAMSDLATRLMVELPEPEATILPRRNDGNGGTRTRGRDRLAAAIARDPQVEVVNRIARDVSHAVSLLQDLGGDGGDIANELAQAAFTEAEGRVGEVLVLLRDAQGRVSIRLKEQFESRLKQLEDRQTAMITSGVSVNLRPEIDRIRSDVKAGRREAALQRIDLLDRNLSGMESDWRGLQGLLRQIEGLRESARLLELDLAEPDDSLRQVRVILAQPALDVGALDHAAELAAEAVMKLHDSIPLALEEYMDRLSAQVATWPSASEGRRRAADLDREARRLLTSNRLVEATQRATELQQLISSIGVPPAPLATEEPAPAPIEVPIVSKPLDRIPARKVERIERPAPVPRAEVPEALPSESTPPVTAPSPTKPAASPSPHPVVPRAVEPTHPTPVKTHAASPASPTQHADTVRSLVAQARALAARIQRLPGHSALARAAAVEIRNATDLLRERKLDEAERTLADLKERLDRSLPEKQK